MFITYKVVNLITGMYYIGSHKTDNLDDKYLGSGKLIRRSVEIYGAQNHKKEILGIFSTREESLELEHFLIKQKRAVQDPNLLNLSTGGGSFDYINENLEIDRSAFARLGGKKSAAISASKHQKLLDIYYASPVTCKCCGKILPWEQRINSFCSNSCSARYNNPLRPLNSSKRSFICPVCHKEILILPSDRRKFCSISCAGKGQRRMKKSLRTEKLLADFDLIKQRRANGDTLYKIALDYDVSENQVKELLKGRLF